MAFASCCDPARFREDFECKTEEVEGGVQFTVTAKDPEKAQALKKMLEARKVLCGDSNCC